MSGRRNAENLNDDGSDSWTDSSHNSGSSDSDSSAPEWDPDVSQDGELFYIKFKEIDKISLSQSKSSLLDVRDAFNNRNNFKRSSTRRASKGKIFKVLHYRKRKTDNKNRNTPDQSVSNEKDEIKHDLSSDVVIKVERTKHFHSDKNCPIEELFGISLTNAENEDHWIVDNILSEARNVYAGKVKKGYRLLTINRQEVNVANLSIILNKYKYDRSKFILTFRNVTPEKLNIEFKNLLSSKTEHEYVLSQVLKETMVSLIYINSDMLDETNSDQSVVYCYPRPYSQNFLYNARGAFITLNHLSSKGLFTNAPTCSTINVNNTLINVVYVQNAKNANLMLVAIPNRTLNKFCAKLAVEDLVRMIEFLFGSLGNCFMDRENLYKTDHLLSRFFAMLVCRFDIDGKTTITMDEVKTGTVIGSNLFENVLQVAHAVTLPREARLQIDDALSELEAADYREWTDDPLDCQRLFVVIGCCLFYSGCLLSSHLQDEDLKDIHAFLRINGLLKLSCMGSADKLVVWREVFVSAHRTQNVGEINANEYKIPDGRWFLLVIGKGNFILTSLMEAGGCTEQLEGTPAPSPFYVEECESCLELLLEVGLGRFLSGWFESNVRPQVELHPECLGKGKRIKENAGTASPKVEAKASVKADHHSIMKRRHHSSDHINQPGGFETNYGSHHNLYSQWYSGQKYGASALDVTYSEDSNSQLSCSDLNEDRVMGRRDRDRNRRDSSESDSEWEGQGGSRTSGSIDMTEMRKSLFDVIDKESVHRITAGEENVLFHFLELDIGRGVLLAPVKDLARTKSSSLYGFILNMFRAASQKIHVILQNTVRLKTLSQSSSVGKSLVAVKEHGILLTVPAPLLPGGKNDAFHFWVIGRLISGPEPKELYICHHESVPQDMLEVACKLSYLE